VDVVVADARPLRFADGTPVRAASAVAPYAGGWLVAQDDATHGCFLRSPAGPGTRVRLLPPVGDHETFDEALGTKHLKPDLEAACALGDAVLLLGSGSTRARMRAVLLAPAAPGPVVGDLAPLYARVTRELGIEPEQLNLEGACVQGGVLRWFHRGRPAAGLPSASVDLPLEPLLAAIRGTSAPDEVPVTRVRVIDLGDGLAVTDAVALDERTVLVSTVLEDSPNAYDDGPVLASGLAVLVDGGVAERARLPEVAGRVAKVEGLAIVASGPELRLLATVDADDPAVPSAALDLRVRRQRLL
jgi:hypothetical protein